MRRVPLAKAKAQLGELVRRAAEGESTQITVRGRPVAQIVKSEGQRARFDWEELRQLTDSMPEYPEPPEGWVRAMRDSERF